MRLSYCITSKGFQAQMYTDYDNTSEKIREEFDARIPEFSVLCTKTFEWGNFVFDELIEWIASNNNWEEWLARDGKYPLY